MSRIPAETNSGLKVLSQTNDHTCKKAKKAQMKQRNKWLFFFVTKVGVAVSVSLAHQEHLPHTLIPEAPCKNKTRQTAAFLRQREAIWAGKPTIRTDNKSKKPNHPPNTQQQNKKLFQHRQTGGAGYSGTRWQRPRKAHHNSCDAVRSRLISQLLCLHEKCCQPSLAFHSAQAPI